jgi:hypothetical protein
MGAFSYGCTAAFHSAAFHSDRTQPNYTGDVAEPRSEPLITGAGRRDLPAGQDRR